MGKIHLIYIATSALIGFGLLCLVAAAVMMMIGHSPESYVYNYQAELLANVAYFTFGAGWLLRIIFREK